VDVVKKQNGGLKGQNDHESLKLKLADDDTSSNGNDMIEIIVKTSLELIYLVKVQVILHKNNKIQNKENKYGLRLKVVGL
jgi:SHS2 domain-containing protein